MSARVHLIAVASMIAALAVGPAPARAASCSVSMIADLPVTMRDLRATVPVRINGKDTEFWLDSGAWFSIMPKARAEELALPTSPAPQGFYMVGIGGSHGVDIATVKDFGIVGHSLHNVQFLVGGSDSGNALIGRNILSLADTEFDLAHGSVKLMKPAGCGKANMAYWAAGKPYFVAKAPDAPDNRDFRVSVAINGHPVLAMIASGSPYSLLSQRAAERAGIDLKGPGAVPIHGLSGFGRKILDGWTVPVASVAIGEEQVLQTRLDVIQGTIGGDTGPDMLLGADFLLAHHLYYARSENLVFFTYTGGKVFRATGPAAPPATATTPVALPPGSIRVQAADFATEPKTASEFARRGAARLATGEAALALADYDAAIKLAPTDPTLYRDRARAHAANHAPREARADFDTAIKLSPGDPDLIRSRALLRHFDGDDTGALADADAAAKLTHPAALASREIAELYIELGHADRAIPLFNAMIAAHHDDSRLPELYNGRCWSRALAGLALPEALADCNRALKGRPGNPGILDSRALVRYRMGDYAGALADYDIVLGAAPPPDWSHYMRGLTRIALGQVDTGKAERDAALAGSKGIAARARYYHLEK